MSMNAWSSLFSRGEQPKSHREVCGCYCLLFIVYCLLFIVYCLLLIVDC